MGLTVVLTSFFYLLKLSIQSLTLLVKARYRHWRAKAAFMKTLIREGVSQEAAQELAQVYPNPVNKILSLINMNRSRERF
jgi:hypothetical protein